MAIYGYGSQPFVYDWRAQNWENPLPTLAATWP